MKYLNPELWISWIREFRFASPSWLLLFLIIPFIALYLFSRRKRRNAAVQYSDIKNPATNYVFLAECDPRGFNRGSWVMRPKSKQWVDPFATWHRRNSSTLGWADGRVDNHRWLGPGLIEWNEQALYNVASFDFYRTPAADDELKDFEFALKGYAYKSLL